MRRLLSARRIVPTLCQLVARAALVVVVGATALVPPALDWRSGGTAAAAPAKPNFVVIVTDDQRWDTIGRCMNGFDGHDMKAGEASCMPFLQQRLAANGVTFERGYVTTSLCCPSRASILTGQYGRHTGVMDNFGFPSFKDASSIATWLDDAGYKTALIGKYLNGYGESCCYTPPNYVPPGWDVWHSFWGRPGYTSYSMVHRDGETALVTTAYSGTTTAPTPCAPGTIYSTDHLCRRALDFLQTPGTDAFFLYFAPFSPHELETAPSRWVNAYSSSNDAIALPQYPNYNAIPSPNPPRWLPTSPWTETKMRGVSSAFRRALATNRAVDDAVDALYRQLEADGRLSNTVFVFLSDNGLSFGEHRHDTKACEYEECHRVPFVVACPPAICPGATPGSVDADHLVLNIDIAPTIADLAGVTPGLRIDGRSLVPLITGGSSDWRTSYLLEEHSIARRDAPLGIMARAADGHVYKYVKFLGAADQFEMYDLTEDPWELANLAGDGVHYGIQSWLAASLEAAFNPPVITLAAGPSGPVASSDATFRWTSDEAADYECSLDGAAFARCGNGTSGERTFTGLTLSEHVFRVRAIDADNNVSGAVSRTFTVTADTTPPPVPVLDAVPGDPSDQDVRFSFSQAEDDATVECSLDAAAFATCVSPHELSGLAHGSHEFALRAVDAAGNASQVVRHAWQVRDVTPPAPPTLTSAPADPSGGGVAFAFTHDEPDVTFECSIDDGAFEPCASPHSYRTLADGPHGFAVRAMDAGGNVSAGAAHAWSVDDSPPAPVLTEVPPDPSRAGASFSFTTEEGLSSWCSLDDSPFERCTSPHGYSEVGEGRHLFRVRSSTEAGDVSGSASHGWTVDATPPAAPRIVSAPADPSRDDVVVAFEGGESGVVFECSLDEKPFRACASPLALSDLPEGLRRLRIVAVDAAGNPSDPVVTDWTVDATAPAAPTFVQVPSDPSTPDVAFSFTGAEAGLDFGCSLDGAAFTSCASPVSYASLSGGLHDFKVIATDAAGNVSAAASHTWTVDALPPAVTMNGPNDTLLSSRTVRAQWSASDASGVVGYDVFERVGTAGTQTFVRSQTTTSYQSTGDPGRTYCHQVRAYDAAGNAATSGERCQAIVDDDRSPVVTYAGAVTQEAATSAYSGTLTLLDAAGEEAAFSFTGRKFGVLARRTPASGVMRVDLDGVAVADVDLYSSAVRDRALVFQRVVEPGPHTVRIVWTGTSGGSSGGTDLHLDGVGAVTP